MAQDVVSWLIDRPESAPVGGELQDLIAHEVGLEKNTIAERVRTIQAQLEELKHSFPEAADRKFLDLCIYAVGQIGNQ